MTEIREADLLFSAEEIAELLQASAIELSDEGMALLHDRTEGWAAGLRLATISLAGHPDPERFVRDFSGSERSVAGYLMAEVLERQPDEVRELLLRTSIPDRVPGNLKAPEIAAVLFVSASSTRTAALRRLRAPASSACLRPRGSPRSPASRSTI